MKSRPAKLLLRTSTQVLCVPIHFTHHYVLHVDYHLDYTTNYEVLCDMTNMTLSNTMRLAVSTIEEEQPPIVP